MEWLVSLSSRASWRPFYSTRESFFYGSATSGLRYAKMLPWQSVILDLEALDQAPVQTADVCIIGAGAAGIALAVECSRLGMTVLLLEAGGAHFEAASQSLYSSEIAGRPHTGIHEGRFRVFGGTTTRWGGQILELDPLDFEHRAWVPDSGWPIPKTELDRCIPPRARNRRCRAGNPQRPRPFGTRRSYARSRRRARARAILHPLLPAARFRQTPPRLSRNQPERHRLSARQLLWIPAQ